MNTWHVHKHSKTSVFLGQATSPDAAKVIAQRAARGKLEWEETYNDNFYATDSNKDEYAIEHYYK